MCVCVRGGGSHLTTRFKDEFIGIGHYLLGRKEGGGGAKREGGEAINKLQASIGGNVDFKKVPCRM